jgi:hypothetical protein
MESNPTRSLKRLQAAYQSFSRTHDKAAMPWSRPDDRAESEAALKKALADAQRMTEALDKQVLAPEQQRIRNELVTWTTMAAGTLKEQVGQ